MCFGPACVSPWFILRMVQNILQVSFEGVRGVMDTVVRNGQSDPSSNTRGVCYQFIKRYE